MFDLVPFVGVNLRQEVLNHVLLPVVNRAVSFDLVRLELYILNVQASVVGKVSERYLDELFGKKIVLLGDMRVVQQVQHRLLAAHCGSRHVRRC